MAAKEGPWLRERTHDGLAACSWLDAGVTGKMHACVKCTAVRTLQQRGFAPKTVNFDVIEYPSSYDPAKPLQGPALPTRCTE